MNGIPVLHVEGDCIARAWELSLIALNEKGCNLKTEYDKPEDPPSKDATMIITITDPLSEPMIHKDFPGGPLELQEYVMEVCEGIKDHVLRVGSTDQAQELRRADSNQTMLIICRKSFRGLHELRCRAAMRAAHNEPPVAGQRIT